MQIAIREKGKVRWVELDKVISKFINSKKATALPISSSRDSGHYMGRKPRRNKVSLTGRNILQKI